MHPLRFIALGLATVALTLAGSASVLAASAPSSVSLDASFCTQPGPQQYCYDIDGTLRFLDTAAGSTVQVNKVTKTTGSRTASRSAARSA